MNPDYRPGLCPIAERYYKESLALTDICQYPYTARHVDLFVKALKKVLAHKEDLA